MSWARPLCPSEGPLNPILATHNHQDQLRLEISRTKHGLEAWSALLSRHLPSTAVGLRTPGTQPFTSAVWWPRWVLFVSFSLHSTVWPLAPFYQAFLLGYRNFSACYYLRRGSGISRRGTGLLQDVPRGPDLPAIPE